MKYRMNIVVGNEITDHKVVFSLNCNFFYDEEQYGNGHYVSIVGKDFSKQVIDLRYDTSFDRNNKEKWIEHWAKTYWNGKDGAYSLESLLRLLNYIHGMIFTTEQTAKDMEMMN